MKVFLDANILFSAARSGSLIVRLLHVIAAHGACVTNTYALEEARRNITIKRYGTLEELDRTLSFVSIEEHRTSTVPVALKEKDVPILSGAILLQCTHLLTGDEKDFGSYFGATIEGVLILSPRMMTEFLIQRGVISA